MATKLMMIREDHRNHILTIEHDGKEGVRPHPEMGAFIVPGNVKVVRCAECDYTFIAERDYEVEPIPDWELAALPEPDEPEDGDAPEPWRG